MGILVLLAFTFSCSKKIIFTSEVNYLTSTGGTLTVRTTGIGSDLQSALSAAERQVFDVLFFRGLPGSEQKTALIGSNETEEMNMQKDYFNNFYSKNRYKTFIMSSIPKTGLINQKGKGGKVVVDVKINLMALRKDLEESNIIRKFGY